MREKRRVGLLDAFIVTVILLSVVGIVLRMQALRVSEDDDSEALARATVYAIRAESAECLQEGEVLYLADGTAYGILESVEVVPARVRIAENGEIHVGEWTDGSRVDLTLTITLTGRMTDGGFLRTGGALVLMGERLVLHGRCFAAEARITEVRTA
ncbi:MAG: DUF4330 family protein [Clostridia bacterium]|nr:DUF4330 family protein [Clostridia bacterium]